MGDTISALPLQASYVRPSIESLEHQPVPLGVAESISMSVLLGVRGRRS